MFTRHLPEGKDHTQASASFMPSSILKGNPNVSIEVTDHIATKRGLSTASLRAQTIDQVHGAGDSKHTVRRSPEIQVCECSPTSKSDCNSDDCSMQRLKESTSLHEFSFQTMPTNVEPEGSWGDCGVQEIYLYSPTEAHKDSQCRPAVATLDVQCHLDLITVNVLDRLGVSAVSYEDTEESLVWIDNNSRLALRGPVSLLWRSRRFYKFYETKFYIPKGIEDDKLPFEVILSQKTIDRLGISTVKHCWMSHLPMRNPMNDAALKQMMACVEAQEQSAQSNAILVREHAATRRASVRNFGRDANVIQSTQNHSEEECSNQGCSCQHCSSQG